VDPPRNKAWAEAITRAASAVKGEGGQKVIVLFR
jgi:hypothetical protein